MGRVSDIAALHYNHISVAIGEGHRVFMWGQCRGQSITVPTPTPLAHLHDALACYASPSVMHRPLFLYAAEEMSIVDCLRQAFDDSVCLIFTYFFFYIYLHISMNSKFININTIVDNK